MPELHEMTALEQAEAVRSRRVSPVELVEHYLDRIERRNVELGAFITVTGENALARAAEAEAQLTRSDPATLPPLTRQIAKGAGLDPRELLARTISRL